MNLLPQDQVANRLYKHLRRSERKWLPTKQGRASDSGEPGWTRTCFTFCLEASELNLFPLFLVKQQIQAQYTAPCW